MTIEAQYVATIADLHAEIEVRKTAAEKVYLEQAAEIERLRAQLAGLIEKGMDDLTMVATFQVNEELRAEVERLTANCKGWYDQNVNLIEQRDKVWEENKSLRAEMDQRMAAYVEYQERDEAEVERLRAALDRAADALEFYDNKAEAQKARRALETK